MVVKIIDKKIVGFLQLLKNNKEKFVTIDLIAVDNDFQRQNIARDMISFAESFYQNYSKIFVGTQVANIPSVRLYEKLGFRLKKTEYVLHYHGVKWMFIDNINLDEKVLIIAEIGNNHEGDYDIAKDIRVKEIHYKLTSLLFSDSLAA